MAFPASKRELGELYTFFRLLGDGYTLLGTVKVTADESVAPWPIAMIQRQEHDGPRRYYIEDHQVRIVYGEVNKQTNAFIPVGDKDEVTFAQKEFADAADGVLHLMKEGTLVDDGSGDIEVPDTLEAFLDRVRIYDLEAKTEDRTDLSIAFWNADAPLTGFSVRCRLSPMNPLLDGGRTANLKFEKTGAKFAGPMINKINAIPESATEVKERMLMTERLGGILKYSDVADKVFRCNLLMIDLHFPRLLAEMVRTFHLQGISKVSELIEAMKEMNPLKIKDELIRKHGYYEFKMKQFLMALALGMRPAKIYRGIDSALEGMFMVTGDGQVLCYHKNRSQIFADFLYYNSRFEKGSLEKDKYGFLEKENDILYLKLNVKIGLVKR